MKRILCTYHCGGKGCHSHFSSLAAFDAHRLDGECWPEGHEHGLRVKTEHGICAMYGAPKAEVSIWEDGASVDKARAYFGSRQTPEEALF